MRSICPSIHSGERYIISMCMPEDGSLHSSPGSQKRLSISALSPKSVRRKSTGTSRTQLRHSNRLTAIGNVSADQLLSTYIGTLRDRNSLRMSTVPGISPRIARTKHQLTLPCLDEVV